MSFSSFFLLEENWGGSEGKKFLLFPLISASPFFSIYLHVIIFSRGPMFKSSEQRNDVFKECTLWILLSSTHFGGLSGSYAINCGGVLSIRMNNLRGMLIGIPVLAKERRQSVVERHFITFASQAELNLSFFHCKELTQLVLLLIRCFPLLTCSFLLCKSEFHLHLFC